MTDSLRTRIAAAVGDYHQRWGIKCECGADHAHAYGVADAVIRELTAAIPPIVATAIQGYVQAELAAISHHGEAGEYEMLKRLDREALQIARYATKHKDWNG